MKVLIFVTFSLLVAYAAAGNPFEDDPIAGTRASTMPGRFDRNFNGNVENVLQKAISEFDNKMNPHRIPDLKASWAQGFTVDYKNVDIYGLADLFVSESYIYMTKKHNVLLYVRFVNKNGLIMKSEGSSWSKYSQKATGDFTATGVDKRGVNYFAKLYIDMKTGNIEVDFKEFQEPNLSISIKSNNIEDKSKVVEASEYNIKGQVFRAVYKAVYAILKKMDTKPLMPTLNKYLQEAIKTEY